MALKFFNVFRATLSGGTQTLDATHEFPSGAVGTANSGAVINTDAGLVYTNGLDCPSSNDHIYFTVTTDDILASATGSFALSFRITAFVSTATLFLASNTGAATNYILLEMNGTDDATGRELRLSIRRAGNPLVTLTTTGADLQTGTRYSVVCRYAESLNDRAIEVYNADGSLRTSISDTSTSFLSPTGVNRMYIGETVAAAVNGVDFHIGSLMTADAYAEPLEDNLDVDSYASYGAGGGGGEVASTPMQDLLNGFGGARAARLNGVLQ